MINFSKIKKFTEKFNIDKNRNLAFFLSTVWVSVLLFAWEPYISVTLNTEYVFPLVIDIDALNNIAVWKFFSNIILSGDIFLTQNGSNLSAYSNVVPLLSLYLNAAITHTVGNFGSMLIYHVLFPSLCYVYLVKIYLQYLPHRWSISLAFLGLFSFADYPFRNFLIGIFTGGFEVYLPVLDLPDVVGQPFPSFSLFVFLFLFYKSIIATKLGSSGQLMMSVLWGLQGYIHILNLVFGLPFWILSLGIYYLRLSRSRHSKLTNASLINRFLLNVLMMSIISIPIIVKIITTSQNLSYIHDLDFDWFFILAYITMPLLLVFLCFLSFKIDPYQLVVKFYVVWVTMIVEVGLRVVWHMYGFGLSSETISARLGLFFLHLFYYVPAIYYAHNTFIWYYEGSEATKFAYYFRRIFSFLFRHLSFVYLIVFNFLLSAFVLMGASNFHKNFNSKIKSTYENVQYNITSQSYVSKLNTSNLEILYFMINKFSDDTLSNVSWTNRYVEAVGLEDAIKGFAEHAHDQSWSSEQFELFMLPNAYFERELPFLIYEHAIVPGLGYWLLMNSQSLEKEKLSDFKSLVLNLYHKSGASEYAVE